MIRIKLTRNLPTQYFFSEFQKIDIATAIGFATVGFIGFFVKLLHIPINNIIVGSLTFYCYLLKKWEKKDTIKSLRSDNDVVDGNVDEFDEKSDKSHDGKSNGGCNSDLLEFWKKKCVIRIKLDLNHKCKSCARVKMVVKKDWIVK